MAAPTRGTSSLAARAGRWSAQHRKKAIWGWLAFVAIAFVIGGALGVKKPANQNDYIGQSGRADRLIDNHFPKQEDETVLVQAPKGGTATDPAVRKAVDDVIAGVSGQQGVAEVKSPYAKGNQGQVSRTGARCSWSSRFAATTTRRASASIRSSTRWRRSRPTTPRSSSASSAAPAPTRRSRSPSRTTSRRP